MSVIDTERYAPGELQFPFNEGRLARQAGAGRSAAESPP
jgi:hypothetical protein